MTTQTAIPQPRQTARVRSRQYLVEGVVPPPRFVHGPAAHLAPHRGGDENRDELEAVLAEDDGAEAEHERRKAAHLSRRTR